MSLEAAANATAVLEPGDDLQPDPSPGQRSPWPRPRLGEMFFREEAETDLNPSTEPLSGDASDSAGGEPIDLDESPEAIGQPASSGSAPQLVSKAQLKETFRAGVAISTTTAHKMAARTPGQQHVGLYLADEEDCKGIGDPLAEIAHRRGGLAGGQLSPDTNNLLQAVMAIAGYVAKQVRGVQDARTIDGQIRAGVRPSDDEQVQA